MDILTQIANLFTTPELYQAALEQSALLLLPALGGVISERSGVVNIAMEGMMLTGAFVAVVVGLQTGNPWLATIAAMIAGGLMALLHAIVSIRFRADQIISGFAINIFAGGLTALLSARIFGLLDAGRIDPSQALPYLHIPVLGDLDFVGKVFFQQNIVVYLALLILVGVEILLFRTRLGLRIRAVGEHPQAADTAGINVQRIRFGAVISSGFLSAMAGAFLSLSIVGTFNPNMTAGRGYIALAAMIFGKWSPRGAFVACLIFGLGEAIATYGQTALNLSESNTFLLSMVPYVVTVIVIAGLVGRSIPPKADGVPYEPGVE
jgi:simple sugar transport system permease protein